LFLHELDDPAGAVVLNVLGQVGVLGDELATGARSLAVLDELLHAVEPGPHGGELIVGGGR